MPTPEGKVKTKIRKVLDEYGAWYFMPYQAGFTKRGIPDFIGVFRGRSFAVEAKAEGGKVSALQEREMEQMREAGCRVFLVEGDKLFELAAWLEIVANPN